MPVLTVSGTPEEIGSAAGVLALQPGKRIARYPEEILKRFCVGFLWGSVVKAGQTMVEQFPPDYRKELDALAVAGQPIGITREQLIAANTLFDLKKIVACSALLVEPGRSATGGPLLARNLDFPTLGYLQEYSLVTVYRPRDAKHAFATIGFPGVMGCLSGMNDAGLTVAVLEVTQVRVGESWFDINGVPYALCYRRVLEECSTIDEAHTLLSQMKRTALSNLVVADKQGVAVFEITPQRVLVRRGPHGASVCTNHFLSDELRPRVQLNFYNTLDRFTALERVAQMDRPLGTAELHVAMHAVSHPLDTLQTMIFEPATLRLHLAMGMTPSSGAELHVLDLGPLLAGKLD